LNTFLDHNLLDYDALYFCTCLQTFWKNAGFEVLTCEGKVVACNFLVIPAFIFDLPFEFDNSFFEFLAFNLQENSRLGHSMCNVDHVNAQIDK
jgi:hypothetical protein